MTIAKRSVGVFAAGLIAATALGIAPAAANNYAPGLPPATAGVPNNPPAAAPIVPSVTLVSASDAAKAEERVMNKPPAARVGDAPRPTVTAGEPVALTATALKPGATYVVLIKRKGGSYGTLGSVVGTGSGEGVLPVFEPTRPGTYIMALRNVQTGEVVYIKVRATA